MFAIDTILVWFFALLSGVVVVFFREIPEAPLLLPLYLASAALALALPSLTRNWTEERKILFRGILCYVFVPLTFVSLGHVLSRVSPDDRQWSVLSWDRKFFGQHHLRDLQSLGHPVLTDLVQMAYGSFYLLPGILACAIYRQKRWFALEQTFTTILFGFFLSYLLYFLFPVKSPNEILPDMWQKGWIVAETLARNTREMEFLKRDCFPSGHTMMTLVTIGLAWRFHRKAFWLMLPVACGIVFATVYLGYHYFVDLIAGALAATFVLFISKRGCFDRNTPAKNPTWIPA